jgi:hypothetical protein
MNHNPKRRNTMKKFLIITTLAVFASAFAAVAQDAPKGERPAGARPGGQRPMPPLYAALDANKDGVIDATEIANASAALKTLDKNNDGQLTREELMPPRPQGAGEGRGPRPEGERRGPPPPKE